jgi:hypothetical protein
MLCGIPIDGPDGWPETAQGGRTDAKSGRPGQEKESLSVVRDTFGAEPENGPDLPNDHPSTWVMAHVIRLLFSVDVLGSGQWRPFCRA